MKNKMSKQRLTVKTALQIFSLICGIAVAAFSLYLSRRAIVSVVTGTARVRVIEQHPKNKSQPGSLEHGDSTEPKYKTVELQSKERILYFVFFLITCCPASMCIGVICAGAYYTRKICKHRNQKRVEEAKNRLKRQSERTDVSALPPNPASAPQRVEPATAPSTLPASTATKPVPSLRYGEPYPKAARTPASGQTNRLNRASYRHTAAKWYEDLRYKWNPNPGYTGTEQRRSNFQSGEDGFQMTTLRNNHGDTTASRGAGLGIIEEDVGGTGRYGARRGNRNTQMTEFPML